jgi:arabinogalactan oligomer / maltooligosaccharide transport system substrate-binding protein
MRIRLRVVPSALGLVVLLAACGPAEPTPVPGSGSPQGPGSLTIWSGWGDYQVLQELCGAWAQARFASCDVFPKDLENLTQEFERAASTGEGPDILAHPHDTLGELVQQDLVRPIDLGATTNQFVDVAIDALEVDGRLYGVPMAVENVALLTNRALSPQCPTSMEELTVQAGQLIAAGTSVKGVALGMQVGDTGDGYHWHPLYTAGGGYLFGRDQQGALDPEDLGVGKPGSVQAGVRLQDLADAGLVRADQSRQVLEKAFTLGKLAWWITGQWSLPAVTEAGIDLMVCPVPSWSDGAPSQPLVGVQALFLSSAAQNPELATDFLTQYATGEEFQDGMMESGRPPARKASLDKAVASDPVLAGFAAYAQQGVPMPSIPEIDTVWAELGAAEVDILNGADPQATMESAGQDIAAALDDGQ